MEFHSIKSVIFGIFVIISIYETVSQCIESTPCHCMLEDGTGYDLTSLKDKNFIVGDTKNFTFKVCGNGNLTFEGVKGSVSECGSTSVCMLDSTGMSINLGRMEEGKWELSNEKNLVFHHTSSIKKISYETRINLICCSKCTRSFLEFDYYSENKYNLVFVSRNNCIVRLKAKGLSTGSSLVIIFSVFTGLYFIGGAVALKIFRGAVGLELIPNYDFWFDLPGLVRDGVIFTFNGCTIVSYERI